MRNRLVFWLPGSPFGVRSLFPSGVRALATLLIALPAAAELLPHASLRQLTTMVPVVVEAQPVSQSDARSPTRYKVLQILKGNMVNVGDVITVSFRHHSLRTYGRELGKVQIDRMLLFLRRDINNWQVYMSGFRCLSGSGEVFVPKQVRTLGGYYLVSEGNVNWQMLVNRARADVTATNAVFALLDIEDPALRNRAIFEWIEAHYSELGYGFSNRPGSETGWAQSEKGCSIGLWTPASLKTAGERPHCLSTDQTVPAGPQVGHRPSLPRRAADCSCVFYGMTSRNRITNWP